MEPFEEDGVVTLRSWIDSETKKLDAGRPEVLLYQSTREQQIHKLWASEQWESAIELATAEIKALGVEKMQARGHFEQRFFDLLKIPYLACRAQDEMRMGRFDVASKTLDMIFQIENGAIYPYSIASAAPDVRSPPSLRVFGYSCSTAPHLEISSSLCIRSYRRGLGVHGKGPQVWRGGSAHARARFDRFGGPWRLEALD
jgi:hypothetical protein